MIINLKSQISNLKSLNRGFTLVETIIYIAIVSIILVSITYLILDILGGQTKNTANLEVGYNLRMINNLLTQDIRKSSDFSRPDSQILNLVFPGDDIIYFFDSNSRQLSRQVGNQSPIIINTAAVEVIGSFSDLSYLPRAKSVGVNIQVIYKNSDNLSEYNASSTASFATELRGRR